MEVLVIHNNSINESHDLHLKKKCINVYFEKIMVLEKHPFTLVKPEPCHKQRLSPFRTTYYQMHSFLDS